MLLFHQLQRFLLASSIAAALLLGNSSAAFASPEVYEFSVENGFYTEHQIRDRQLWSFSWSSLLFRLGGCSADDTCHNYQHGPCACPDCSKPVLPHWKPYCSGMYSSSGSNSEYLADGSSGSSGGSSQYNEDNANGGTGGQQGNRTLKIWLLAAAAAAVATTGAAFLMRKRSMAASSNDRALLSDSSAVGKTNYMLMGGMGAAVAGMMTRMGLKPKTDGEETVASKGSGMVSQRMSQAQNGSVSLSRSPSVKKPAFIEIPGDGSVMSHTDLIDVEEGIEVEGPFRPSTSYAI